MQTFYRRLLTTDATFAFGFGSACQSARSPQADSALIADSVSHEVALAKWLADSTARDSVSRLVSTDSLYRLYRAMLTASDPRDLLQSRACERYRLMTRHGSIPVELAVERMEDTVWRGVAPSVLRKLNQSLGGFTEINLSDEICGVRGPWGARIINGTHMDEMTDRPRPARR